MFNKINIGIHAQTLGEPSGLIAGSEITTQGLAKAFLSHDSVKSVDRIGGGKYKKTNANFDLFIIEGWHPALSNLIKQLRKDHPKIIILHWCLSFYGFNEVARLNVDGYLCNSEKVTTLLSKIAPAHFVMLAVDTETFKPREKSKKYEHNVVFLGIRNQSRNEQVLKQTLGEASEFGLAIYGYGWENDLTYRRYWKGVLPIGHIADLYCSANVILGITEERQRKMGMINNRVFEALACGSSFISDYSNELERVFQNSILFSRKPGDTSRHLESILKRCDKTDIVNEKGRSLVLRDHTYDHRVQCILDFSKKLIDNNYN